MSVRAAAGCGRSARVDGLDMPSLLQRITELSRSKQGRSLIKQVQNRLAGDNKNTKRGNRSKRSR